MTGEAATLFRARDLRTGRIIIALVSLLLSAPILFYPLARDAGIFAYSAQAILSGQTPYVDFLDQKPPAIFLLYAIPMKLSGGSLGSIHLFEWIWVALTALAASLAGKRIGGSLAGYLTGVSTALFLSPAFCGFWDRTEIETFLSLPYALVIVLLLCRNESRRARDAVIAGVLAGICCAFKPNAAALPALAALVTYGARLRAGSTRGKRLRAIAHAAIFGAAFLLPPLLISGWLSIQGALKPFIDHMVSMNTSYISADPLTTLGLFFTQNAAATVVIVALTSVAALLARREPRVSSDSNSIEFGGSAERMRHALLLGALWAGGIATVVSGRFLFPYHHQVLVLPAALTVSLSMAVLVTPALRWMSGWFGRDAPVRFLAFVVPAALAVGAMAYALKPEDRAFYSGRLSIDQYHDSDRFVVWDFNYADDRALARELDRITRPADRVQVFGHGSLALLLAGRRSASRFVYTGPAMDPLYGGGGKDREEILKCLEQAPPQVVVITHHDPLHRFGTMTSDRQVRDFTPLAGFLKSNYRQAGMIGDYEILEHTRGAATSTEQPRAEASMPTSPSTPAPASR